MITSARVTSDLAVPPGEYLQEVLEEQGMSQADLSRRLGRPVQAVNEIVKGTKAITPETALQLEQVLPVPAHIWTGLEEAYRLALARDDEQEGVDQELGLVDPALYRALAAGGQVPDVAGGSKGTRRERVRALRRFFGVASLRNLPKVQTYRAAFRVSVTGRVEEFALAAWLRWGELSARQRTGLGQFDAKRIRALIPWLRSCTRMAPEAWQYTVTEELARCGVALVMVPHLPGTRAHGATYWPTPNSAVVQLSLRHKRLDIFWFSFFHELGHLLRHKKREVYVSFHRSATQSQGPDEQDADDFARDVLIPREAYRDLRERGRFSRAAIKEVAVALDVHASIVLGRLQREGLVSPRSLNDLHAYFEWVDRREAG